MALAAIALFPVAIASAAEPLGTSGIRLVSQEQTVSPLQKLKNRSPLKRWEQNKQQWIDARPQAFLLDEEEAEKTSSAPHLSPVEDSDHARNPKPFPDERLMKNASSPSLPPQQPVSNNQQPRFQNQQEKLQPVPQEKPVPRLAAMQRQVERPPYVEEVIESPKDLRKVSEINPFYDYEPNDDVRREDPCLNLCPRPEDCPEYGPDEIVPECPEEIQLTDAVYGGREFPHLHYFWAAPNFHHNPLYFQDVQLERYGHTYHELIQPFASVAQFGTQFLAIPYQMTLDPPHERKYTLGYYRPGECAPYLQHQVPLNTEAGLVQAGVTTGLFYIFP